MKLRRFYLMMITPNYTRINSKNAIHLKLEIWLIIASLTSDMQWFNNKNKRMTMMEMMMIIMKNKLNKTVPLNQKWSLSTLKNKARILNNLAKLIWAHKNNQMVKIRA